ncbi:MAG: succinate dehydrogenase/fumarate reductase iron-sulfur subunit [Pseudanabaenaceae cyanobacterium bins.68]|nr:succinate dehydrogenase/fumarate reductase iron-sulfur subunit [Pseudanabaenaceae cyanobacterium bins.68]
MNNLVVHIRRQPSRTSPSAWQAFTVAIDPHSQTVLDLLHKIQWQQDGSLSFRRNCRNVICGSCAMRINGRAGLACQKLIAEVLEQDRVTELAIEPMGNLPVIKDLVVDMTKFWQNLARVDPHVVTGQAPLQEFLQTPAQRQQLQAASNCILCGSCYSECQAVTVNQEFVGPHALAKAQRLVADNRDQSLDSRLAKYSDLDFAWGCTRCFNCNEVCPVEVAPLDRISEVKQVILAAAQPSADPQVATAVRHRQTMVELVKESGWIDESKFGLAVVADNLRNWSGLWSLLPLGWRMWRRGKLPYPWQFRPSIAVKQIRMLIESVQKPKV